MTCSSVISPDTVEVQQEAQPTWRGCRVEQGTLEVAGRGTNVAAGGIWNRWSWALHVTTHRADTCQEKTWDWVRNHETDTKRGRYPMGKSWFDWVSREAHRTSDIREKKSCRVDNTISVLPSTTSVEPPYPRAFGRWHRHVFVISFFQSRIQPGLLCGIADCAGTVDDVIDGVRFWLVQEPVL